MANAGKDSSHAEGACSVLVTGAAGYIGSQVIKRLAADRRGLSSIVAMDVREVPAQQRLEGIEYAVGDVRDESVVETMRAHKVDTAVHLASIMLPGPEDRADFEYSVDVLGTRNVVEACLATGARRFIITSSGAAYGYYADNPEWLDEDDAIRGNDAFRYSKHKRLIEEMLAVYRKERPELEQLVLRPGTVLGETVSNQITAIFERPVILGVQGASTPFVFIWDQDVVACILEGIHGARAGIYNLAGDGVMTLEEIAARVGKTYIALPAWLISGALSLLHPLGLSPYGPEQVDFLRYRPVLSNRRLKEEFGYTPRLSSREVFELYWTSKTGTAKKS